MGVPKFFRYISERYPCLSEVIKEYQIPEFDNLYLDMNGIIHTCSHPVDGDPHFRITEENIFRDIFHYIEVLFRMIKPRKLFFMAIDGVAPRAKMNQQRGRRFRTAKEAVTLENKARERGEILPDEARFDSNCITPGTVFMARLQEHLKYFVVNKITTDKLWQDCKIILSGHETPGEGEHKIMDYIRYMRAQPGYDPNTRHCLYGLDADLIMLGLCTHEPHFSLLREEVKFGKKSTKHKNIPEQITFFLLHLSLLREYLELEFYQLKDCLSFDYDMEKVIDDWVLMGFLVGNDFIPHLPNMHIANGALPILYNAYMKVLPTLGGYINESGTLNLERFEAFIQELSSIDIDNFSEKYADLKWFEGKTGRKFNEKHKPEFHDSDECVQPGQDKMNYENEKPKPVNADLQSLIQATNEFLEESVSQINLTDDMDLEEICGPEGESETSDNDDDLFNAEFVQHKTDYYMNKLEYADVTEEVLKSQAEEYVRAIQWNLNYYYNGVCSWSWFYPHHYAPYVSDIKGFTNLIIQFNLGQPFHPYEQLLAVLPAASKTLLPIAFQDLMTDETSLIKEYYPEDFKTDMNGKKQEWEAVVLIPFIDEVILLKAMESGYTRLTAEEKQRNSPGPMLVYEYTSENLGQFESPGYFPSITSSHAACQRICIKDIQVPKDKLIKGAYPGAKFDVYYPGFPTLKHLEYEGKLEKSRVQVFEHPSRGENMMLYIKSNVEDTPTPDAIAKELLGVSVHIGWPHLIEALVTSISCKEYRYHGTGTIGQYNVEENKGKLVSLWNSEKQGITERYKTRLGVNVGATDVLVHARLMIGRKYTFNKNGDILLEKQWANISNAFPLQTIVKNITVYEENFTIFKNINSVFPLNTRCFMLGQPCYGAMGEVLDSRETLKNGRVKVCMQKLEEPDLNSVKRLDNDLRVRYMNLHTASAKLGISKGLFSRITGCVFVAPGKEQNNSSDDVPKINIGLNLKFNKRNEEVPGYTRKDENTWLYSEKVITLVRSYMELWPKVFVYLNYHVKNDVYFEEDVFPDGKAKDQLKNITTWIKQQPFYSIEHQVCGSSVVDPEAIQLLENVIDDFNKHSVKNKQLTMQVKPHLLFKPSLQMGNLMPDPTATFQLYDRIVNVREGYSVPLGLKGTIIGIHRNGTNLESDTTYYTLFDEPFAGGLTINSSANRGYRLPKPAIINISHGKRIAEPQRGVLDFPKHNTSHNNYNNASYVPNTYPAKGYAQTNLFVPNWSQNGNYTNRPLFVPPSQNYNSFNYQNIKSAYNSSFHRGGFLHESTYTNNGPNTFVPYKANHFPLNPPLFQGQYNTKNASNSNLQTHPSLDGKNTDKHGAQDEKKERNMKKGFKDSELNNTSHNQNSTTFHKTHQTELVDNEFNSNVLKKILKINDGQSSSSTEQNPKNINKEPTTSSVNEFFNKARITKQSRSPQKNQGTKSEASSQLVYNTAVLLKEFQKRLLGVPNYQYLKMRENVLASIKMPTGNVIFGQPGKDQEEAAENAATEVLNLLRKGKIKDYQTTQKPSLDAVPEPPKQWQTTKILQNPQTSKQNTTFRSTENWREDNREKSKQNNDTSYKHSNINSGGGRDDQSHSNSQHKNSSNVKVNGPFVPLQAVRQQRSRTTSSTVNEAQSKKNKVIQKDSNNETKSSALPMNSNVSTTQTSGKPRRARKMRIAANFKNTMS